MNLLVFHLEIAFGEVLKLITNNEVDLENYLIKQGFTNIKFTDLRTSYGTCSLKDQYGTELTVYSHGLKWEADNTREKRK